MTAQGPDHALSLEVRPVAIAGDEQHIEAPTQETGTLPQLPDEREPGGRASITMPRIAPGRYLAVEDGEDTILYALSDLMHIGRSPGADIVLDDASVSRRHALVTKRGETTVILDDRSLNGVSVNGVRVSEKPLADGDTVMVGHVTLRYVERV
jgi:pSer/pThr/pTyr-binding forkhead associated (FHA) protein